MALQRQRVLVVESDPQLRAFFERALPAPEFSVETAAPGPEALRLAAWRPALVLLDVGDGAADDALIRQLRRRAPVPLLVFSLDEAVAADAAALRLAADDFLAAPFTVEELQARVRRALRRPPAALPAPRDLHVGQLEIDLEAGTVARGGRLVPLSRTDWALLALLVRHAGQVLPYRTIAQHIWDDAAPETIGNVRSYVKRLRDALEDDPKSPRYLLTEPRLGYRFALPPPEPQRALPAAQRRAGAPSLPRPLTSFVGRAADVVAVRAVLERPEVRLVTLTGPGGVGKTRLALHIGRGLTAGLADGAYFVDLAHCRTSDMVIAQLGQALGFSDRSAAGGLEHLKEELRPNALLLILDNFEQVLVAAPLVGELLQAAPHVKVLATSRMPLHILGEHEYQVPPLALPRQDTGLSVAELEAAPAVALFVDRARAVKPDYALTPEDAAAVATICAALDGLPLAVELAAVRIKVLPPRQMATRLADRLALLTGGARDLPARQQTMRDVLDWSYDLLDPTHRPLFERLAVFAGGATLAAVEAVCAPQDAGAFDILDSLQGLIDASLLQTRTIASEARFAMLSVIQEYAADLLARSGAGDTIRQRHLAYYLGLAEEAAPALQRAHHREWLARLERDHENLRAALGWASDTGQLEMVARLVAALWQFWHVHRHHREAFRWVELALSQREQLPPAVRARVQYGAGWLAYDRRELERATGYFVDSLVVTRALGDLVAVSEVLRGQGEVALAQGAAAQAQTLFEESLALSRATGSRVDEAWSLHHLGKVALLRGAFADATALLEASRVSFAALKDSAGLAWSLHNLGRIALETARYPEAEPLLRESVRLFGELGDKGGAAWSLLNLGRARREQRQPAEAEPLLRESLALFREVGELPGGGWALYELAQCAALRDDDSLAATLRDDSVRQFRRAGDTAGLAQVVALHAQPPASNSLDTPAHRP